MTVETDWRAETFQYTQSWFWYHAKQRYDSIQVFAQKFFILPLLAVASLYASSFKALGMGRIAICIVSLGLCIVGIIYTRLFKQLEHRNLDLVKRGAEALSTFEENRCMWNAPILLTGLVRKDGDSATGGRGPTHKKIFSSLFTVSYIFYVLIAIIVLVQLCVSFSDELLNQKSTATVKGGFSMNQTIYLAGSVSSDWREQVKTSVPNMIFVDPKSSQLSNPSEYTAWNLHWLSKSSVVLAYMEQSNLSGYGIAFEVGYAKAQQKLIILVDDRSRKDNEFAEHFSTVHEAADICFDNLGQAISFIQNLVENGPSPK